MTTIASDSRNSSNKTPSGTNDDHGVDIAPSRLRSSKDPHNADNTAEYAGHENNLIKFRHPGYPDAFNQNILLRLQAFDRDGGGLHYGTALAACSLVAGNTETGYLTLERDGAKIELEHDQLLRYKSYYFYHGRIAMYPIYLSFRHYTFPHDRLPAAWAALDHLYEVGHGNYDGRNNTTPLAPPSASNLTSFVVARDKCCRVAEDLGADYMDRAHLCPRSEASWFEANGMGEYNRNKNLSGDFVVDDTRNAIALRKDIHSAFDDGKFVIVPKQNSWVVQFLGQTNSLGRQFHNTRIQLDNISTQFLYTRFAWTIFPGIKQFLEAGVPRHVILRITEDGGHSEVTKHLSGDELKEKIQEGGPSRGRSSSPRKRKAQGNTPAEEAGTHFVKRVCHSHDHDLPALDRSVKTNLTRASDTPESSFATLADDETVRVNKQEWIRSRRPSDPALYCCNYNTAEEAFRAGVAEDSKFGGGYLCDKCLGIDYAEGREDVG